MATVSDAIFGGADIVHDVYNALCSFTLPPGMHIITVVVWFPPNNVGFRRIGLSDDKIKFNMNRFAANIVQSVSNHDAPVFLHYNHIITKESTLYLMAQQNSGTTFTNCGYGIHIMSFGNPKRYTIPHEFLNQPI